MVNKPKTSKHFKIDKQTKRMMALMKFPTTVKVNAQELKDLKERGIELEDMSQKDYKSLMISAQLSEIDAKLSGLDDPLWKPKKEEKHEEASAEGNTAGNNSNKKRKGKKISKMRSPEAVEKTETA